MRQINLSQPTNPMSAQASDTYTGSLHQYNGLDELISLTQTDPDTEQSQQTLFAYNNNGKLTAKVYRYADITYCRTYN
jgi:hypothetical protein